MWDFEFVVPRYLEQQDETPGDDEDDEEQLHSDYPTVVVCSGDLLEQVRHLILLTLRVIEGGTGITSA